MPIILNGRLNLLIGLIFLFFSFSCKNYSDILKDNIPPVLDSTTLTGYSPAQDTVVLSWQSATDNISMPSEITYDICVSTIPGGCANFFANYTTTAGAVSYTVVGLAPSTYYYFRVRPRDKAGNPGNVTPDLQVKTAVPASGAPVFGVNPGNYAVAQNVSITSGTAGALICYTLNTGTPACDTTPACTIGTSLANGNTVAVSANGTTTLRAVACSSATTGSSVATGAYYIDTVAPGAPGGFSASGVGSSNLTLSWTAATDNLTPQANLVYEVCQSTTTGSCAAGFSVAYTSAPGAVSLNVSGLSAGTQYFFLVRTKDNVGNVTNGTEISATTTSLGSITLNPFTPAAGSFNAAQVITITGSGTLICYTVDGTNPVPNAARNGCTNGTSYAGGVSISTSATLKAIGSQPGYTDSAISSAAYIIDTQPPSVPTAFSGAGASSSQINLTWSASTDNNTPTGSIVYQICQASASGGCNGGSFVATYTTAAGATSKSVTGLAISTTYYFVIRSMDSVNNVSTGSSEISAATTSGAAVATPTFSVPAGYYNSTQSVTISTATAGAIICYQIGSPPGACTVGPVCAAGATTSTVASISSTNTLYAIGCKATFSDSAVASAAYTIDSVAPTTGTAITIANVTDSSLTVNWGVAVDNLTPGTALQYKVVKDNTAAANINTVASADAKTGADLIQDWAPNFSTVNVAGLTGTNTYYFAVLVKDQAGNKSLYAPVGQTITAAGFSVTPTSGLITTKVGGAATFKVHLNAPPTGSVSFNLTSSNVAQGTVSPASLTFTSANYATDQTVTVTGQEDNNLANNIGYTITSAAASSTDALYNGLTPASVSVTNQWGDVRKQIYITAATMNGTSVAVSDYCSTDTNKPNASVYTEMAYNGFNLNIAISNIFAANQKYYRPLPDGRLIGSTNASNQPIFNLSNSIGAAVGSYWTGITTTFTSGANCYDVLAGSNWAKTTATALIGDATSTTITAISNGTSGCGLSTTRHLACVEK